MTPDRYPWHSAILAGLVGGAIPLMGAATLPGLLLMGLLLWSPFAWSALSLGWGFSLVSTGVACTVLTLAQGFKEGFFFAFFHGLPFVALGAWHTYAPLVLRAPKLLKVTPWYIWLGMACGISMYIQGYWQEDLQQNLSRLQDLLQRETALKSSPSIPSMTQTLLHALLPGLGAMGWALCVLLNLNLAQKLNRGLNLIFPKQLDMGPLEIETEFIAAVAGAGLLGMVAPHETRSTFWNLFLVLLLPGLLMGFKIVHFFAHTRSFPYVFLTSFYMLVLSGFSWLLPVIVLLGFLEPWLQLRAKISTLNHRQGE